MFPLSEKNDSIAIVSKLVTHKFNKRTDERIEPAPNPFTVEGKINCLILETVEIRKEIKSLQKSGANLRADIPTMLRDELKRFRGDI